MVDDDDEWLPIKLQKQVEVFRNHWNEVDFVYNWVLYKNEKGDVIERFCPTAKGNVLKEFLNDIVVTLPNPSATLIKQECLIRAGLFDETLQRCQDLDMWIRLLEKDVRVYPIKEFNTICQASVNDKSFRNKKGFFRLAVKHFGLFFKYSPLRFFYLLWFMIGMKFGLRNKFAHLSGIFHRN